MPPYASPSYKPSPKAPLGSGGRFKYLQKKLTKPGVTNPGALAASIGRKKYGPKKFGQLSRKRSVARY